MEQLRYLAIAIDFVAIAILVVGFVSLLYLFVKKALKGDLPKGLYHEFRLFRWRLGQILLLALEILIVSDVIFSIAHRTIEEIVILGVTVLIRICLSYFLNIELQHLEKSDKVD